MNSIKTKPMISDRIVLKYIPEYHIISNEERLESLQRLGKSGIENMKVDVFNSLNHTSYATWKQCENHLSKLDVNCINEFYKNILNIIGYGNNNIWFNIFYKVQPSTIINESIHTMDVEVFWKHQEDCKLYLGDYLENDYFPYFDEFEGMMIIDDKVYTINIHTKDQYVFNNIKNFSTNYFNKLFFFTEQTKKNVKKHLNRNLLKHNNGLNANYFNESNHGFMYVVYKESNHIDIVIDNVKMAKMLTLEDFHNVCENNKTITDRIISTISDLNKDMTHSINKYIKES